jgi:hypothetical protein
MKRWEGTSLSMYVDDGVIFAAADTWAQTAARLQEGYRDCINWLTRARLSAEPDKTELLFSGGVVTQMLDQPTSTFSTR